MECSLTCTWRQSLSATEYTATVLMPSSLQARMTRTAISPLFAMSTFLICAVGVAGDALAATTWEALFARDAWTCCLRDARDTNSPPSSPRRSLFKLALGIRDGV